MQLTVEKPSTGYAPGLPLERREVYQQSVPNLVILNTTSALSCSLADPAIDWTPDLTDPDDAADPKAVADRWCSLFERHAFFMAILTGAGFQPRSIESLATHPVWIAKLAQGTGFLTGDVRVVMRDLRALFRTHGVRLDRESPSVGVRRHEVAVSWLADEGVPGKVTWHSDGRCEEVVYEIPEPQLLEDLLIENPDEDELAVVQ